MARLNLRIFIVAYERHFPKPVLFLQGIRYITWPVKSFCVGLKKALSFIGRSVRRLFHRPSDSDDVEPGHLVILGVDPPQNEPICKSHVEAIKQDYHTSLQKVFGKSEFVQDVIRSIHACMDSEEG